MPYPQSIIFDLDGTLLNTIEDLTDAMNAVLRRRGFPERSVDECRYLVGEGAESFVGGALPPESRSPENIRDVLDSYRTAYSKTWSNKTRPYPGMPDLLEELNERGVGFAVLSNKSDALVKATVAHFFPGVVFAVVRGAGAGTPLKPDPTSALAIARSLRCSPDRMFLVGDTKIDMQTARSAGMIPVGVLWGFRTEEELRQNGAQYLALRAADILDIVETG